MANKPISNTTTTVQLDGDKAFIKPVCFTIKPEDCLFKAHRRYVDVHFDENDIGFYTCGKRTTCILKPGDFLVCYPQDAHKVAIAPDSPP